MQESTHTTAGESLCATGLAPEIAFFRTAPGALDFPKAHPPDAGGADLYVKTQVRQWCSASLRLVLRGSLTGSLQDRRLCMHQLAGGRGH